MAWDKKYPLALCSCRYPMLLLTHVCVVCEGGVCAAVPGVGGHAVVSAVLPPRHGAARTSDHVDTVIQLVSNRAESAT